MIKLAQIGNCLVFLDKLVNFFNKFLHINSSSTNFFFHAVNPQAMAAFQNPRLIDTVQHFEHLTNANNTRAGWHGNHDLKVKQQLILHHYLHHDHVRNNHVTSSSNQNPVKPVHASINQQHGLKRQPNNEDADHLSSSLASSDVHHQRPQVKRLVSRQSEINPGGQASKQHNFHEFR